VGWGAWESGRDLGERKLRTLGALRRSDQLADGLLADAQPVRDRPVAHPLTLQHLDAAQTLPADTSSTPTPIDELRGIYDTGRLTSPIDGVVTRIASNKGSVVRAGEPLIEPRGNQRFILAYLPTGGLYSVHGATNTINMGLRSTYGIISKVEPIAAALPREFQRAFAGGASASYPHRIFRG
jgi:hypothetical protein